MAQKAEKMLLKIIN